MPPSRISRFIYLGTKFFSLIALSGIMLGVASQAATFTWTTISSGNASGSWGTQANWSGATLPATTNDTVDFNTLDITANSTVSLNGNQSANSLNFGDQNTASAASWLINAGSPSTATLTLGGANPTINVANLAGGQAAVINAVIAGTTGFTKTGGSFLQLNGANTYSGTTIISGSGCYISAGNANAFGTGTVQVGGTVGEGQIWFNSAGNLTLTNAFEIRTTRWIIDNSTVNGVGAGNLTVNGNVLLNTGSSGVRDIYCNENLTINGNLSVTPTTNPINKQGGYVLTLNGTNTIGGASAVNGGTLAVNGPLNGGAPFSVNSGGALIVNGTVNSASTVTVNSGGVISGTGNIAGFLIVTNGGNLTPGTNGSGTLTCGRLISYTGANFNFYFGATNNPNNTLIKVGNGVTLAGNLNITDLGGFSSGVYTGLQYSGALVYNKLTNGIIAGGRTVLVDTTSTHGYVLFDVLNGTLNPAAGQNLPMDLASPLPLSWLQVPGATAYDVYLGTVSNAVATATTNTAGIYQGRTNTLALNIAGLQPNTTYYWRVDGVAANGTPTTGTVYSFTTGAAIVDLMEDTWVATDALGRSLPGLAECGSTRTNRPIGMFYYLWQHNSGTYGDGGANWDVSQYLSANPYANPHDPWASNPIMQTALSTYWWGHPQLDYYDPSDPWVLRRQIALLNHAGIDVLIFDYSNATTYDNQLYALCNMIRQMRFEGEKINLKIAFLTHANSGTTATYLYNTLYSQNKYADLWYYWQGKPLILGYVNGSGSGDTVPSSAVQNFFTWRTSWANYTTSMQDEWSWIDTPTPQHWNYDARTDLPEQVPVSCGGWANGNLGKSHSNNSQQDYDNDHLPLQHTSRLGVFFKEQMNYGLKYDPQFLFLTQWNEWIAGSFAAPTDCYTHLLADCCPVGGFYFVDEYNEEYSRDMEPMKGGHTDNYYYQMAGQNRLRKGVRPIPPASAPQTINLAGDFTQWTNVAPAYYDAVNDTIWRNYPGASATQMGTYTNNSGRNDFTVLKVARDANNFYFFAQCNSNLTSYTGSNWMVLFINADQNFNTGWNGYDYAVNLGGVGPSTTTLWQNTSVSNGWTWTPVRSDIAYTLSGNQLMLAIPRASVGLGADPVQFDFHWADNFLTNDIADFGVDGDSAPDGRFNYRYITTTNTEVTLLSDDFENGEQGVWGQTWTTGSLWSLTTAKPYSGNYCAVANYAASGQSNLIASVNTLGYGSLRLNFHYKLANVLNAQNLQISYLTTNGWVPIRQLSRDEYYPVSQSWGTNEQQNVWLNFADTRYNTGPDARFFTTNFAFRIDASALSASGQQVFVDAVSLTADTQIPAAVSPQTWQTQDIGNAGNTGYVMTNGAAFTVSGSGLDIWNDGDAFRFLYQTRNGDGTLTARVTGITPTDPWAKAGVMIRESLDSGARNATMILSAGNGVAFQQRTAALAATTSTIVGPSVAPPYWVQVVRSGPNFTGSVSTDGTHWTQIGTTTIAGFNSTALWGLAVTAHNNSLTNVATFDNVTSVQTPVIAPVGNQTLIAGQTLWLTNSILNPDTPPLTLTWNLLSAPPGMTLDPALGSLSWRPTISQSPSTNLISFSVTDSGSPALSATQQFSVNVLSPATPGLLPANFSNGTFSMQVSGDPGPDYYLQATTNLAPPVSWQSILTNLSATPPFQFNDLNVSNYVDRFYRVQIGP